MLHRIEEVDNALENNYINLNLTALIAKDIDNIRLTEAWSSDSANSVSHAEASNNVIAHLFSRSGVFEFSDPNTEKYYSVIKQTVSKNSVGLTNLELQEMTRLSVDTTNIVTMAIPISGSELKCDNMLLVKTMITPVLNPKSRKEVTLVDGKLRKKYGNHSTYILLSKDAVISKKSRMFGQDINVVGRICSIHNSVNATSTASTDALFEVFSFQFKGNMTVEEICPSNGSLSSNTWIFTAGTHKLKLPLVCSLQSERINCDSVTLHSSV